MGSDLKARTFDTTPSPTITLLFSPSGLQNMNGISALAEVSNLMSFASVPDVISTIVVAILQTSACASLTMLTLISLIAMVLFRAMGNLRALAEYFVNNDADSGASCYMQSIRNQTYQDPAASASQLDYDIRIPREPLSQTAVSRSSRDLAQLNLCGSTVILLINIIIGDAVVWWRALALWPEHRVLRLLAIVLLVTTFAMGVADAGLVCSVKPVPEANDLYRGTAYGFAATILTVVTNAAATALIGYRAWQHRKFIRANLRALSCRTQVQRVMGVLVESGAVYCLFWICVLGLGIFERSPKAAHGSGAGEHFDVFVIYFLPAFFAPLVAMYPTVVILLVTLTRARCDMLFADQSKFASLPLPFSLRQISAADQSTVEFAVNSTDSEERRASVVAPPL